MLKEKQEKEEEALRSEFLTAVDPCAGQQPCDTNAALASANDFLLNAEKMIKESKAAVEKSAKELKAANQKLEALLKKASMHELEAEDAFRKAKAKTQTEEAKAVVEEEKAAEATKVVEKAKKVAEADKKAALDAEKLVNEAVLSLAFLSFLFPPRSLVSVCVCLVASSLT